MATVFSLMSRQLGVFNSQVWRRIQELAKEESTEGAAEYNGLADALSKMLKGASEVTSILKALPEHEGQILRDRVRILHEPEKTVEVQKSNAATTRRGRGRAGRGSTEEEKQAVLHLFTSRDLTDEKEIKRVLASELKFPDVTLRSIKMIINHILKQKALETEEIGEKDTSSTPSEPSATPQPPAGE